MRCRGEGQQAATRTWGSCLARREHHPCKAELRFRRHLFVDLTTNRTHAIDAIPSDPTYPPATMSAPDPKEAWQRLQTELSRRTQQFNRGGGSPKGALGGLGGLVLVGGGIWLANNALFNGV